MRKYKIDETEIPSLHVSEHLDIMKKFSFWLKQMGINTSKCRISFYIKFLEELLINEKLNSSENKVDEIKSIEERIKEINTKLENIELNVPENEVLKKDYFGYVLREVHELMWIYKGFKNRSPKGDAELFKTIIGGKKFSRNDTDRTARNYQLEARIASYFLQAGYEVDLGIEADVIAHSDKDRYFIECKRLNSPSQVNARIKKAAKQLKKLKNNKPLQRRNFGIAVFDVTKLAYPHDGLTWGMTDDHCKDVIQSKLREIEKLYNFGEPFLKNKNVILIWLQIHIPSINLLKGHQTTRFSNYFLGLIPPIGYRARAFERLKSVIDVGPYENFGS